MYGTSSSIERHLGILVNIKLKFHEECSAGMIHQAFEHINIHMILHLYKSLVYDQLWNTGTLFGVHRLLIIQYGSASH